MTNTINDIADSKDVLAYFCDNKTTYISFKLNKNDKKNIYYNFKVITRMRRERDKVPEIKKMFVDHKVKMDSLEILLFFVDEKNYC